MKAIQFFLVLIMFIFTSSCVSTKYTHSQVMDNAVKGKSKEEILRHFGLPTQKQVEGSYEQWVYDLGQGTISLPLPSNSRTKVQVNPYSNSADISTRTYGGGSISGIFNRCIKVTFQNGYGFNWETIGVDYTVTESNPVGTVLIVIGTVVGGILLGVLMGG